MSAGQGHINPPADHRVVRLVHDIGMRSILTNLISHLESLTGSGPREDYLTELKANLERALTDYEARYSGEEL